jgi:hypothetical protein
MPIDKDKEDPRSTAEKARADLKANAELGLAPPESPAMTRPSVTPETFGEKKGFKDDAPSAEDDALSRAKE